MHENQGPNFYETNTHAQNGLLAFNLHHNFDSRFIDRSFQFKRFGLDV